MNMRPTSKAKAKQWPFPRQNAFKLQLREAAIKWFKQKNLATHSKMDYCLESFDKWPGNIILPEVTNYIKTFKSNSSSNKDAFPLHKYLHHGLSSQALAFNLVGPLIVRNDYAPLQNLIDNNGSKPKISKVEFEYDDRNVFNEDSGQPTSLDIALFDDQNNPLYLIECKLTESEFGRCSVLAQGDCDGKNPINRYDECYLHFIERDYWKLMEKYDITKFLENDKQCIFSNYYQFFRELLFCIEKGAKYILLYDQRSPVFYQDYYGTKRGIFAFLIALLPQHVQSHISLITIQELVNEIEISKRHSDWIPEFKIKYAL